jgi:hypothetical protein
MFCSAKAVAARCGGNLKAALGYCQYMIETYPHLKAEYLQVQRLLISDLTPTAAA